MRAVLLALALSVPAIALSNDARLEDIRERGRLICGVGQPAQGFYNSSADGSPHGIEADFCRAVAAALFGTGAHVQFVIVHTLPELRAHPEVDLVVHRLTRSLAREEKFAVRFGPTLFYDGLAILVEADKKQNLDGVPICVREGMGSVERLAEHFRSRRLRLNAVLYGSAEEAERALQDGKCQAIVDDASQLIGVQARAQRRARKMVMLPDRLSREPLAPVLRAGDEQLRQLLEWVFAVLLEAEARGVTSATARADQDCGVLRHRLQLERSSGSALGLSEDWSCAVLGTIGNYAEMYDRSFGRGSGATHDRGINRLWKDGGLMYPPRLQ